jgi:hypothetical protein
MKTFKKFLYLLFIACFISCKQENRNTIITIKNSLNFERTKEVIEIKISSLHLDDAATIGIKNQETDELQVTQLVDVEGDGTMDHILFQPKVAANSVASFEVITITATQSRKFMLLSICSGANRRLYMGK